jgi:hypothetical protein
VLNKGYEVDDPVTIGYRADGGACEFVNDGLVKLDTYAWNWEHASIKWRPSIHMPKWASRITLRITDIGVERVQDIGGDDARAEGVNPGKGPTSEILHSRETGHQNCFRTLWDSINEKRGYGWVKNPWVWVVEFEVVG